MKDKVLQYLTEKCKDMGLTEKALGELSELGSKTLTDEASDEDIVKAVDSLVPFARSMQAEITRKTSNKMQSTKKQSKEDGNGEGNNNSGDTMPEWFKPFQDKLTQLEGENAALKQEKVKAERTSTIAAKAKKLGIPDYLVKRCTFSDDADIDKELESFKQELVSHSLMPKEQALETGTAEQAMKEAASSWAKSLPDA